jgi:uncharacterized protein YifE (UPF0438 family)
MSQALTQDEFAFGCSIEVFPSEEVAALRRYGRRLESLALGQLQPTSAEDEHFLLVNRDDAEPQTVAERAWVRRKARLEIEQAEKQKAPPESPQNYGMIEFDADRCWW